MIFRGCCLQWELAFLHFRQRWKNASPHRKWQIPCKVKGFVVIAGISIPTSNSQETPSQQAYLNVWQYAKSEARVVEKAVSRGCLFGIFWGIFEGFSRLLFTVEISIPTFPAALKECKPQSNMGGNPLPKWEKLWLAR